MSEQQADYHVVRQLPTAPPLVSPGANHVVTVRTANQDVFVWPTIEWDLLYCHEELTELARLVQKINAPDHARNHDTAELPLEDRLHLEYGQVLMMVLTTGLELGLDHDKALRMATAKITETAARKRIRTA